MWRLKGCPKCGGDAFVEWDYGSGEWCETCLQCSCRRYLASMMAAERFAAGRDANEREPATDEEWQRLLAEPASR